MRGDKLDKRIDDRLGDMVDRSDGQWIYQGFRPSLTAGKHPLVRRDTKQRVAMIDGASVYRAAHPAGVYLGHRGERFRIVSYLKKPARRKSQRNVASVSSFLQSLDQIIVEPEERQVATRGQWREEVQLVEKMQPVVPDGKKLASSIEYGKWEWRRRFDGYEEYELNGRGAIRAVPLQEVVSRYRAAAEAGLSMPFLPDLRYRTLGWRCKLGDALPGGPLGAALAVAVTALLSAHFCSAVECSQDDLHILVVPKAAELRVLDRAPGGNGLSEALLRLSCLPTVMGQVEQEVRRFIGEPEDWFYTFLNDRGRCPIAVSPEEVANVLGKIAKVL